MTTNPTGHSMLFVCSVLSAALAVLLCSGCVLAQPEASSSASAVQAGVHGQWQGVLTRKGPELGAWWALTDNQGQTWRLVSSSPAQDQQLMQWQNRTVKVLGTGLAPMLSTPRIQLGEVSLINH